MKKGLEVADNDEAKKHANIARLVLDRAEHSDQFWWASKKPWWDINMVAKGLGDQQLAIINAFRAIKSSGCSEDIKRECFKKVILARDCGNRVSKQLFQWQLNSETRSTEATNNGRRRRKPLAAFFFRNYSARKLGSTFQPVTFGNMELRECAPQTT